MKRKTFLTKLYKKWLINISKKLIEDNYNLCRINFKTQWYPNDKDSELSLKTFYSYEYLERYIAYKISTINEYNWEDMIDILETIKKELVKKFSKTTINYIDMQIDKIKRHNIDDPFKKEYKTTIITENKNYILHKVEDVLYPESGATQSEIKKCFPDFNLEKENITDTFIIETKKWH